MRPSIHGNELDLNLLAAFASIHATRSVSEAARLHGIGQPAMSAALARLRRKLGDPLFLRVGGQLVPTPRADALAPAVAAALAALRTALAETAPFQPASARRCFTLAASDYTTRVLAPGLLRALRARAPDCSLRIIGYAKDDAARLVDRGDVDLVLGTFRDPPARAVATTLYRERFVGIARTGHPALADGAMTLEAWLAHPHALFTTRGDMQGEIDDVLARRGLARRVVLATPHLLALPALMAGTDLLAAVPARMAAGLAPMAVQSFALPLATEEWRVMMLWNGATRRDPARGFLRELVREAAAAA